MKETQCEILSNSKQNLFTVKQQQKVVTIKIYTNHFVTLIVYNEYIRFFDLVPIVLIIKTFINYRQSTNSI